MINKIAFTGVQKPVREFMTAAAHEFVPAGKIYSKSEREAAEMAQKSVKESIQDINAIYFNHRGLNTPAVAQEVTVLDAAKSYAASHGLPVDNLK